MTDPAPSKTIKVISTILFFLLMNSIPWNQAEAKETQMQKKLNTLPAGFVYLRDIDPTIRQDLRYATTNNFTGQVVPGYAANECILRRSAAHALSRVQRDFLAKGLSLKIYDCYRPVMAVKAFGKWARRATTIKEKQRYYPRLSKSSLHKKGYIATRSSHSKGNTVDLTLVPIEAGQKQITTNKILPPEACQDDDGLDMGTAFDCFDVLTHTRHPLIPARARKNRHLLVSTMQRHGFKNFYMEWWHFTYLERAMPRKHYNFPISSME